MRRTSYSRPIEKNNNSANHFSTISVKKKEKSENYPEMEDDTVKSLDDSEEQEKIENKEKWHKRK